MQTRGSKKKSKIICLKYRMGNNKAHRNREDSEEMNDHKRAVLNRPSHRKIVRWNDELDKTLMLAIQSACNDCKIKIPWDEVSLLMGDDISAGACVQHLAKLRNTLIKNGANIEPLKRTGPKSNEGVFAEAGRKRSVAEYDEFDDEAYASEDDYTKTQPRKKRSHKKKESHHSMYGGKMLPGMNPGGKVGAGQLGGKSIGPNGLIPREDSEPENEDAPTGDRPQYAGKTVGEAVHPTEGGKSGGQSVYPENVSTSVGEPVPVENVGKSVGGQVHAENIGESVRGQVHPGYAGTMVSNEANRNTGNDVQFVSSQPIKGSQEPQPAAVLFTYEELLAKAQEVSNQTFAEMLKPLFAAQGLTGPVAGVSAGVPLRVPAGAPTGVLAGVPAGSRVGVQGVNHGAATHVGGQVKVINRVDTQWAKENLEDIPYEEARHVLMHEPFPGDAPKPKYAQTEVHPPYQLDHQHQANSADQFDDQYNNNSDKAEGLANALAFNSSAYINFENMFDEEKTNDLQNTTAGNNNVNIDPGLMTNGFAGPSRERLANGYAPEHVSGIFDQPIQPNGPGFDLNDSYFSSEGNQMFMDQYNEPAAPSADLDVQDQFLLAALQAHNQQESYRGGFNSDEADDEGSDDDESSDDESSDNDSSSGESDY